MISRAKYWSTGTVDVRNQIDSQSDLSDSLPQVLKVHRSEPEHGQTYLFPSVEFPLLEILV